jgi:hypothetical protein
MRKFSYLFVISLFPVVLAAQDPDYSLRLMDRSEKMRKKNIEKCHQGSYHHCCHSSIFDEASRNRSSLSAKGQAYFKIAATRPVFSGIPLVHSTPYFDIHYTTTGADAVALTDVNPANSIPDYIDFMASVMDTVHVKAVNDGYTMPPSDGTEGGSSAYDVYIQDLGAGLYGYCQPEDVAGDNPNSPAINEINAMTSYLALSSDYSWTASVDTSVKVTVAHEFFHAIQFGYESNDSDFLYEATAVWMEEHMFPGLDDNLQYLPDFFSDPDVSLNWGDADGSAFSGHFYSAWLYFQHMTEYTNDSIIRTIFVNSISNPDMGGIDLALQEYGKDFKSDFQDFLIANFLLIDSLNYPQYSYDKAQTYKNFIAQAPYNLTGPKIEGSLTYTGSDLTHFSVANGNAKLYRLGADYITVHPDRDCFINLTPNSLSAVIDMVVVAKDSLGNFTVLNSVQQANSYVVNVNVTSSYQEFTAIIYRHDYNIFNQASENYVLRVQNFAAALSAGNALQEIKLYPNPASGLVNIETASFTGVEIHIMDIMGKDIYTSIFDSDKQEINTSGFSDGIYFVTLKQNDQMLFSQRIIIIK